MNGLVLLVNNVDEVVPPITKSVTSALSFERLLHFDQRDLENVKFPLIVNYNRNCKFFKHNIYSKKNIVLQSNLTFFRILLPYQVHRLISFFLSYHFLTRLTG